MAGRPAIYGSAAQRQAAYRARKAGAVLALDEQTFEETIKVLRSVIREADVSPEMKVNLAALADAMSSRDSYTWWKLERQRKDAWGRY